MIKALRYTGITISMITLAVIGVTIVLILPIKAKQNSFTLKAKEGYYSSMSEVYKDIHVEYPAFSFYYSNSEKADFYKGKKDPEFHIRYIYQLLYSGKTDAAIKELEKVNEQYKGRRRELAKYAVAFNKYSFLNFVESVEHMPLLFDVGFMIYEFIYNLQSNEELQTQQTLDELLALAYLRMGEQQNCILNHSDKSCIVPLADEAIYSVEKYSRRAIELLEKSLEKGPRTTGAIWLLNLAYMTIGEYPQSVPPLWLVPPEKILQEGDIMFENIAGMLEVDLGTLVGGTVIEDFDNDGFLDIFTTSYRHVDTCVLYRNDGRGRFTDISKVAGLSDVMGGFNLIHADYNNDGYQDVFILRGGFIMNAGMPNSLLKNNGDGTFTDVTIDAGLLSFHPTQTATWADFDNDGWTDLFIGNESNVFETNKCEFYLNQRDGTFKNIAAEIYLDLKVDAKAVLASDINNDGWQDIFISVIDDKNHLWLNKGIDKNGKLAFKNIGEKAGISDPVYSFSSAIFDYDNDGWQDIIITSDGDDRGPVEDEDNFLLFDNPGSTAVLYKNNGDATFSNVTYNMGIRRPVHGMGLNYGDFDNDGWIDLYIGTGSPSFADVVPNLAYRNIKGAYFKDISYSSRLGHIQKGHGISFGDMDNDGDQDIYASLGGAMEGDVFANAFFLNPGYSNNWVTLRLEGRKSNRSAIGAKVYIKAKRENGTYLELYQVVSNGGSFGSNSLQLEIGLDNAESIEVLKITWPNKETTVEQYKHLAVNKTFFIVEGEGINEIQQYKVQFKATESEQTYHNHHMH